MPGERVPALVRAARVLTLLEQADGRALSVSEMARELSIARSSLFNICLTLEASGFIAKASDGYRLGRRLVELGGAYLRTVDPVQAFYQACNEAPLLHDEICQLAVLDGTDVLYLAAHAGRMPLRMTASIGTRYPAAITAVGNALLTTLDDDEIRGRFADPVTRPAWTDRSITDLDALLEKVRLHRQRGYAKDEGEVLPGICGLAVVVAPQYSGEQPYTLGASLLQQSLDAEREAQVVCALREMAAHIENPMNLTAGSGAP